MKYDFLTIGGATQDISFFSDEGIVLDNRQDLLRQRLLAFEHGAKIKIDKLNSLFGGGASNAAVNLAGLGFKTAAIADLGDDEGGRLIRKNLKDRKVDQSLIRMHKGCNSGLSFILIGKDNERLIFTSRGANDRLIMDDRRRKALKMAKNIYIASLSGPWEKTVKDIFSNTSADIFWNPGVSQLEKGLKKILPFLKKTYCLMLNKDEALELVMSDHKTDKQDKVKLNDLKELARKLKSYGPKIILLTDGENGAVAHDGAEFYLQKIFKQKKKVDATGVGDIYNSTFAAGLLLANGDIAEALRLASRNAASKIAHLGAQNGLLNKKELMK